MTKLVGESMTTWELVRNRDHRTEIWFAELLRVTCGQISFFKWSFRSLAQLATFSAVFVFFSFLYTINDMCVHTVIQVFSSS